MAASRTGKKSDNIEKREIDLAIKATAQYISAWTQREFAALAKNKKMPLCWPLESGGYVIGKNRVLPYNGYWQLQNHNHEPVHVFESKQSAIFYCLCEHIKSTHLADNIRVADNKSLRLKNDVAHYSASLERAIQRKNSFDIDVWSARLDDAKLRLKMAQEQLQKAIKSAKALKVWDKE